MRVAKGNVAWLRARKCRCRLFQARVQHLTATFLSLAGSYFADCEASMPDYSYTTVLEGDHRSMAQHGLFSGVIQPALNVNLTITRQHFP
jgi:hypothetical protein